MPFLIALAGIAVAAYFFILRSRNAANIAGDILDAAVDVKNAARRFGFKRRSNTHPVEDIDDPNIAIAALAVSFLELDDYPTQEHRKALHLNMQSTLDISAKDAEEMTVLGRWLMNECNGPDMAVSRLSRKLHKMSGAAAFTPLLTVLRDTLSAGDSEMNEKQRDALDDVKRAFRIT
ncbi:hypothetical protein [Parasulfitobacter algicola]|uniref:Co-chaperone DjlA N-terminal domain-containing protein n=1 Tax=Parasulfitobacter algicola TaxID=2614809 RepID=A0ABX2IL84_9RHOB|nr:hypothetical protein [Sulfitobacter algicola]NSX53624.1 hypothetical protein [Sulfitobacter algicola]